MHKHTLKIITEYKTNWFDAEISLTETIYSRFIAGESIPELMFDYDRSRTHIETALRFFILKERRNKNIIAEYDRMQLKRFQPS